MPAHVHSRFLPALSVAVCAALSGCGSFNSATQRIASVVTPYKVEVVQGNFVAKEQTDLLKPGLTKAQVRDLLGTPMITSIFHGERWDYAFSLRRKGVQTQARRLTIYFKDNVVERFEGDPLPTEAEFVASLDTGRKDVNPPVLELPADSIKALAPAAAPIAEPQLPPLPTSYPPLEAPAR